MKIEAIAQQSEEYLLMIIKQFEDRLKEKGINLTTEQLQQFKAYYETLVEWNEKMNLTTITEKSDRSHVVLWAKELTRDFVFLRPLGLRLY